jgi:hypothetical protein
MTILTAHGAGNSFVVLVDPDGTRSLSDELARSLCDPVGPLAEDGSGFDGAIRIAPDPEGRGDVVVREVERADVFAEGVVDERGHRFGRERVADPLLGELAGELQRELRTGLHVTLELVDLDLGCAIVVGDGELVVGEGLTRAETGAEGEGRVGALQRAGRGRKAYFRV